MSTKRWRFFTHSDGSRVRLPISKSGPVSLERLRYRMHCRDIGDTRDLRATLRAGKYTTYGSYPIYLIVSDGACLCMDCGRAEYRSISNAIRSGVNDGWRVIHCDVNYESDLTCEHCSNKIESAYGSEE
jgi:hypothetical protein